MQQEETSRGFNLHCEYVINPTIEEIIRECDNAWDEARELLGAAINSDVGEKQANNVYLSLVRSHQELNKTYPAILASMAAGSYNPRAVKKFFKYVKNHQWKTEDEFLDIQSIYSTILYREQHPHVSNAHIKQMRKQTREALADNEKKTKDQVEKIKKEAEENNKKRAEERVVDFSARIKHDATILIHDEVRPIIVNFDDSQ